MLRGSFAEVVPEFTEIPIIQERAGIFHNIGLNIDENVTGAHVAVKNLGPSPRLLMRYERSSSVHHLENRSSDIYSPVHA